MNDTAPLAPPLSAGRVSDLLSRAGVSPQRGEAQAVIARLAAMGVADPGGAEAGAARDAIRARPDGEAALADLRRHAM